MTHGGVAQMVRALGSYPGCHWFDPSHRYQSKLITTPLLHQGSFFYLTNAIIRYASMEDILMSRTLLINIQVMFLVTLTALSCNRNPIDPDVEKPVDPAIVRSSETSHQCLGYSLLTIDTEKVEASIQALRGGNSHFNITGIMNGTMGVSIAMVPAASDPQNGLFAIDITLAHPFGSKPLLTGFDVKGILMTPGTLNIGALVFADPSKGEARLLNADNYSRWWNPVEFTTPGLFGYTQGTLTPTPDGLLTASVNPYKYYADILSAESNLSLVQDAPVPDPLGRGVFLAGSENTRRYEIQFPMNPGPKIVFGYAIDASWSAPGVNPPVDIPNDFPIDANQPEAFNIVVVPTANNLYYDSESGVGGGVLRVKINVHDWQGLESGNIADETLAVTLFSPDLFDGAAYASFLTEMPNKAQYTIDLTGTALPTQSGKVALTVRATSAGGPSYDQGFAPAPDSPVAAWEVIDLDIPNPDCFADINNIPAEAVPIDFNSGYDDQVCSNQDFRDYYSFSLDVGDVLKGTAILNVDATDTRIQLLDSNELVIAQVLYAGGPIVLPFDDLTLTPGKYYFRVETLNDEQVVPYFLEFETEITNISTNVQEITPGWLFCDPDRIFKHDNYLISYGRYGAWVYDVTDPENPVYVSSVLFDGILGENEEAAFFYPYLYFFWEIDFDFSLAMIDFTDVNNPVLHQDVLATPETIKHIDICSENLYLVVQDGPDSILQTMDYLSDPLNPTVLGSVGVASYPEITVYDDNGENTHVLLSDGVVLYNYEVEDPENIGLVDAYWFSDDIRAIDSYEELIFVTEWDAPDGTFNIMTLNGPVITFEDDRPLNGQGYFIYAEGDYAYVSGTYDGMTIYDISDISTIAWESDTSTNGYSKGVVASDGYAYVTLVGQGFEVYDATFPDFPERVYRSPVLNNDVGGFIVDNYYIAGHEGTHSGRSIRVLDISDPANTVVINEIGVDFPMQFVEKIGDYIYFIGYSDTIVYDVSDPLNIIEVADFEVNKSVEDATVHEDYMYMVAADDTVHIIDVSDPSNPQPLITKTIEQEYFWVAASNDYLYCSRYGLLDVYNIATPINPIFVDTIPAGDFSDFEELVATDDYLYATTDYAFKTYDLSNPAAPNLVGFADFPVTQKYLDINGAFAYAGQWKYPLIVSPWPADDPQIIHSFEDVWIYGGASDFKVSDGNLYIATPKGVRIFNLY